MQVQKILVLRFSAMGDVALLVPVIRSVTAAHPDLEVTVVTRPRFAPFFYDMERVKIFPADVDYTYNGFLGMRDLFKALIQKASYDIVIDMHDHLRTRILRTLFKFFFTDVIVFDKGRKIKNRFTRRTNKVTTVLPHTVDRYKAAFEKAGFAFSMLPGPHFILNDTLRQAADTWLEKQQLRGNEKLIGIAPFAMHASKIWPLENYGEWMELVMQQVPARFLLFGGGDREIKFFESLKKKYPDACAIVAGELKIRQEIALMKKLDVMVCVDSSNMHLASLAGVPVVSVWGGTHPDVGFAPYGENNTLVQIPRSELPCRPCSVYGRSSCHVGGFPCLTRITAPQLAERVISRLKIPSATP